MATAAQQDRFERFLYSEAIHINRARLAHLASLGLDLSGKRVLEVGAGIGLLTPFFLQRGCEVVVTDGRPENIEEISHRLPDVESKLLDLEIVSDLSHLGRFDVVFCYGTLYHIANPSKALENLAAICEGILLIETIVSPGSTPEVILYLDPKDVLNQALRGVGCRPTRIWVMQKLTELLGYAYTTVTQPDFPEFETNWETLQTQLNHRAVFVGSRRQLNLSTLVASLPTHQSRLAVGT